MDTSKKQNVELINQFFFTKKTIVIPKIETFAKNNKSF